MANIAKMDHSALVEFFENLPYLKSKEGEKYRQSVLNVVSGDSYLGGRELLRALDSIKDLVDFLEGAEPPLLIRHLKDLWDALRKGAQTLGHA